MRAADPILRGLSAYPDRHFQTMVAQVLDEPVPKATALLTEIVGGIDVERSQGLGDSRKADGNGRFLASDVVGMQQVHGTTTEHFCKPRSLTPESEPQSHDAREHGPTDRP